MRVKGIHVKHLFLLKGFKGTLGLVVLLSVILLSSCQLPVQGQASLDRSSPESQGVSSEGILRFLEAADSSKHEFHSFMMLRHGKVIAEGWWDPYRADLTHTLYSTSKSFTATAVGFAVAEKRITVDDKVISFFPDDLPETVSENLSQLRIRDLLSMSVGHDTDPTWQVAKNNDNWVKAFLEVPVVHKPGTKFVYNSVATYMLSAIVQKVTGQKVFDYLQPRLFGPLGIEGIDWETDPRGINTGGWGLRIKTEDLAKFGQLFLQKGKWQGRQILPESWVEEASTIKIEQDPQAPQERKDASDWLQGYCYQMWRSRHNSYRGDGAYGQFILVLPEQDEVIAITAETPDMQSELNLVWDYILPAIKSGPLPADPLGLAKLRAKLASLSLPPAEPGSSELESKVSGKKYVFERNHKGLESLTVDFKDGVCHAVLGDSTGEYDFDFGGGKWVSGATKRYGPYLVAGFKGERIGLPPFKVRGSYSWKDAKNLVLTLRYIESPHTETIMMRFEGDEIFVDFEDLFNKPDAGKTCKGTIGKRRV